MSRVKRTTFDLFVGNLPAYADKVYVEQLFKKTGEIAGVIVKNSKFNKSKFAYVKFYCKPDAVKAYEMFRFLILDGNTLEVRLVPPKNECNSSFAGNSDGASCGDGTGTVFNQKTGGEEKVVVVCYVDNPVTFYGQSVPNLLELAKISETLQNFCSSFSHVEGIPHINQIYAARFTQDKMWYRCRIIQSEKLKSFVSYIDYGNEERVNNKDIVVLPDDLVMIPPQSSLFVLKDLKPVAADKKDVYDKAIAYLKELINQKVRLHTVFSTERCYFVDKCIWNNMDMYDELQKRGYAHKASSSSEQSSSSHKTKVKASTTDEMNACSLPNSKGIPQQSCNDKANGRMSQHSPNAKANARNPMSLSTLIDDTFKAPATFKKQSAKHFGRELGELEAFRRKNEKLTKELLLEKEKSKALKQEVEILKAEANANPFEKLDSVVLKTQQLFALRCQDSSEDADDLVEVYDVMKAKFPESAKTSNVNPELHAKVEEAILKYQHLVEYVGESEQSEFLSHHISVRDEACKDARDLMKEYLEFWNGDHLTERVVYLQKLLLEMQQKYEQYLTVDVNCGDKSLNDLINEYRESKIKDRTSVETLMKRTNDALSQFSAILDNLKEDITPINNKTEGAAGICIRFTKVAFIESLKEVQKTVDAEIVAKTLMPKSPLSEELMTALIKILIKEIQMPLEEALKEIKDCKKYNLLYPDLCRNLMVKPDASRIYEIRKDVKTLKSKIRHKLADKKDLEESDEVSPAALEEVNSSLDTLLHELHTCFKVEHDEMMKLVEAYRTHFRELNVQNADLNLPAYSKYNGLVKDNWETEHFNFCSVTKRPGMCYTAKFCDEPVVIKEYHLNSDEYDQFLKKIVPWQSIEVNNPVVPVHAVFKSKNGFRAYAMFPHIATLEELEKEFPFSHSDSRQVLLGVLKGLACIHSQGTMHSILNPSTILIKSGKSAPTPLLDFCFGVNNTNAVWESKGVVFCPPEKEMSQASDMYNFGCLILWMLFPNLQFTCASDGVLDITGYKSIVQSLLSDSGYEAVKSLLNVEPSTRPHAESLLQRDIFVELTCNGSSSSENPSHSSSSSVSQSSEVSTVASPEGVSSVAFPEEVSSVASPEGFSSVASPEGFSSVASPEDASTVVPPEDISTVVLPEDVSTVVSSDEFSDAASTSEKQNV